LTLAQGEKEIAKIYTNIASIGSTVVEKLTSDPKLEGSKLDIDTGRERNSKNIY
jgi:hypothetical protein